MEVQEIPTHYANTDLVIICDREPSALKAAFHRRKFFDVMERTLADGSWLGRYETSKQYEEPVANIAGFLNVVEGLKGTALHEWQKCLRREFDIGYDAGHEPFCFEQKLTLGILDRVVKAGVDIRLSVYAADPKYATAPTDLRRPPAKDQR